MKKLFVGFLLMVTANAAVTLSFYRYNTAGPERMFAGYSYVWYLGNIMRGFDATCDSTTNTCYSADYTPAGTESFRIDPDTAPPGGMQNLPIELPNIPEYKATNIGTNGNATGHWNVFRNKSANGTTPIQVTITSTATTHFYYWGSGTIYMHATFGWPAGTVFKYHTNTGTDYQCGVLSQSTDPADGAGTGVNFLWNHRCTEVVIPTSATPGTFDAGWTFCTDAAGTTGCQNLTFTITLEAPPTMELTPPSSMAALPSIYDTSTLCISDKASNVTRPGSNCSFKEITAGTSTTLEHGSNYWCADRVNPDNTLELATPPHWLEFDNNGGYESGAGYLGWYYDAPRAYYSIAQWFNDPLWENCGRAVGARYSQFGPGVAGFPGALLDNTWWGFNAGNSALLGRYQNLYNTIYWSSLHKSSFMNTRFPKGMEIGLGRFNHGNYSSTWAPNAWNGEMKNELRNQVNYNLGGGLTTTYFTGYVLVDTRATGYNLDTYNAYVAAGEPIWKVSSGKPVLTTVGSQYYFAVNSAISLLLTLSQPMNATTSNRNWGQVYTPVWMAVGPLIEPIVEYWEKTHEPRAAKAIRYAADVFKGNYDWTNHSWPVVNEPPPWGPFCSNNASWASQPDTRWYAGAEYSCLTSTPNGYDEIVGMGAYLYAWLWRNWGDDTDRAFADELFTWSLIGDIGAPMNYRYKPKAYYQNAKYWPLYLKYRLGYTK